MSEDEATEALVKKVRKLIKSVEGGVVKFTVRDPLTGEVVGTMERELADYPAEILHHLTEHGALQKIGDAAAGQDGEGALKALVNTDAALMSGQWSSRKPASPKVDISAVKGQIAEMSEEQAEATRRALEAVGITV